MDLQDIQEDNVMQKNFTSRFNSMAFRRAASREYERPYNFYRSPRGGGGFLRRQLSETYLGTPFGAAARDFNQIQREAQNFNLMEEVGKELGEYNSAFEGAEFKIPVHREVLTQRCELFKAQTCSGMRDSDLSLVKVPENFDRDAMTVFVHYLYRDSVPLHLPHDANLTARVLHTAHYYGIPRLVNLCESILGEMLLNIQESKDSNSDAALQLLQLADEEGLLKLREAVLTYIVFHYETIVNSQPYKDISAPLLKLISQKQN